MTSWNKIRLNGLKWKCQDAPKWRSDIFQMLWLIIMNPPCFFLLDLYPTDIQTQPYRYCRHIVAISWIWWSNWWSLINWLPGSTPHLWQRLVTYTVHWSWYHFRFVLSLLAQLIWPPWSVYLIILSWDLKNRSSRFNQDRRNLSGRKIDEDTLILTYEAMKDCPDRTQGGPLSNSPIFPI